MVNFIFHSDNGSWNSTKKRYEFSLTNRIDRPKIFKLQQASLIPSSAPSYPHVVYLKSENLSRIIKTKHTVIAKGDSNQHDIPSDVIGVLTETHVAGRYSLKIPRTFRLVSDPTCALIDFSLEGPDGTVLNGPYTPVTGASWDNLYLSWLASNIGYIFDADHLTSLKTEDGTQTQVVGTEIASFTARLPSTGSCELYRSTENGVQISKINDKTLSISNGDGGSWEYMSDNITVAPAVQGSFIFLYETPSVIAFENLYSIPKTIDIVINGSEVQMKSHTGTYTSSGITLVASTAYIIRCDFEMNELSAPDLRGDYDFLVTRLHPSDSSQNVEYTGSVNDFEIPRTGGSNRHLKLGNAQSQIAGKFGSFAMTTGNLDAKNRTKAWLQAKFLDSEVEVSDPNGVPADLAIQLHVA
jgi:hypothetical protein